jgi:hypothetical protein
MTYDPYNYNGYTITQTDDGIFVGNIEFTSYEDAEEWIDSQVHSTEDSASSTFDFVEMHTYRVFFTPPKGNQYNSVLAPDCIDEEEAIDWVETEYCPGSIVRDIQLWD